MIREGHYLLGVCVISEVIIQESLQIRKWLLLKYQKRIGGILTNETTER